ncbi:MAG: hypothetical protein P1V35_05765 [Planctomycetota bacterium]|nr:hypothetical protein [Planctomycetota bacterium]
MVFAVGQAVDPQSLWSAVAEDQSTGFLVATQQTGPVQKPGL